MTQAERRLARGYLAGLVDGEGCIGSYEWKARRDGKTTIRSRVITIGVTDAELIDAAAACCDLLGIPYRRSTNGHTITGKPVHVLDITTRVGLLRFQRLVPIRSVRKRDRLAAALASYQRRGKLRGHGDPRHIRDVLGDVAVAHHG